MIKIFTFALCSIMAASSAFAASPIIKKMADQRADRNSEYSIQPSLEAGGLVHWTKTFGPDDVIVNPVKGTVNWDIPANIPSESFHIGVKATNVDGEDEDVWIVTIGDGNVIYIGPDEEHKTLKSGMQDMISGDTLIMRNGLWDHNNQANTIPGNEFKAQTLPGGSETAFTTLIGEDPGKVFIDGKDEESLIHLWGNTKHPDWALNNNGSTRNTDYIAIKGLVLVNSRSEAVRINNSKYIKLINLGIGPSSKNSGSYANVYVYRSQFVLIEGMYVWGHGRYKIQFRDSSQGVVRRSVARIDNYIGGEPIGGFISYCSKNILFQNNILVDSDHSSYWGDHEEIINAFGVPATNCEGYPEFNEFKRNMALNVHMGLMSTDARQNPNPTIWNDLIGWDLKPARHNGGNSAVVPILSGVGATVTNHMTLGEVNTEGSYFIYSREKDSTIENSVFYRVGWNGVETLDQGWLTRRGSGGQLYLDYNNIYDFKGGISDPGGYNATETNSLNVNPEIRYIPMLPRNSLLRTGSEDGSRIGAELMTMSGKSGSFYGQDGYNTDTSIPMWPFPGETIIHENFASYSHSGTDRDGADAGISGARGFAVKDQTLTNYVWSYLGNTVPPFNVVAIPGNEKVRLIWSASAPLEQANLKSYKIYQFLAGEKVEKGEVPGDTRTFEISGLSNEEVVHLSVTAISQSDEESDYAYMVSAIPVERPKPKAPILFIE